MACGTLVMAPKFYLDYLGIAYADLRIFDSQVFLPALAVGFIAFIVHAAVAVSYNESTWSADYAKWREQRVCRSCGNVHRLGLIGSRR